MSDMASTITTGAWSLTLERDVIDMTSGLPSWNEQWRFTDRNGHEHHYDRGFPTLREVIDEQHWCDGTEGFARHDPHWHVDRSHHECLECGVTVEPRVDPPYTPKSMPGMTTATLEGPLSDGRHARATLLPDEVEQLRLAGDDFDRVAAELVACLPAERVYWSFTPRNCAPTPPPGLRHRHNRPPENDANRPAAPRGGGTLEAPGGEQADH